jgi:digeranylgeranylglycerophospholipid reductase
MKLEYDVVVVGAGPAGSMTAKNAARGGASVLMLEKRQEIGSPVRCAEGVAMTSIQKTGIKPDLRWIAHEVDGAKVTAPNGTAFYITERMAGDEVGTVIERDIFDKYLAMDAAKAGADIMLKSSVVGVNTYKGAVTGVKVEQMKERFEVDAKVVVAADGFESQVARWAGIDTKLKAADITTCLQYRMVDINIESNFCEFILGSGAPGGYVWIFPKGEDVANVGIGLSVSKLKEKGEVKGYLDKYIKNDDRLKHGKIIDMVAGAVSTCMPIKHTVDEGIMLVGDAARQIDPITGGGIANACRAGKIAGEVLTECHESNDYSKDMLWRYEKGWRDEFSENLYRNYMAKEKLVTLSDDVFNKIISTLAEVGVEKLSTHLILKVIKERHPELVREFEDII